MVRQTAQQARRLVRRILGKERFYSAGTRYPNLTLGNRNSAYVVNPEMLSSSSLVYSFGIGNDISFDLALVRQFSCQVHAFDPTPRSLAWIKAQHLPNELHVHPIGIAGFDGTLVLHPSQDLNGVSYSVVEAGGAPGLECPVYRLRSIMEMLGHARVDVLKMDIEGCEYAAIEDLVSAAIPIPQLCIEFHHRWPEIGVGKTDDAIAALHSVGYRIFHVSANGQEFSFIR